MATTLTDNGSTSQGLLVNGNVILMVPTATAAAPRSAYRHAPGGQRRRHGHVGLGRHRRQRHVGLQSQRYGSDSPRGHRWHRRRAPERQRYDHPHRRQHLHRPHAGHRRHAQHRRGRLADQCGQHQHAQRRRAVDLRHGQPGPPIPTSPSATACRAPRARRTSTAAPWSISAATPC